MVLLLLPAYQQLRLQPTENKTATWVAVFIRPAIAPNHPWNSGHMSTSVKVESIFPAPDPFLEYFFLSFSFPWDWLNLSNSYWGELAPYLRAELLSDLVFLSHSALPLYRDNNQTQPKADYCFIRRDSIDLIFPSFIVILEIPSPVQPSSSARPLPPFCRAAWATSNLRLLLPSLLLFVCSDPSHSYG